MTVNDYNRPEAVRRFQQFANLMQCLHTSLFTCCVFSLCKWFSYGLFTFWHLTLSALLQHHYKGRELLFLIAFKIIFKVLMDHTVGAPPISRQIWTQEHFALGLRSCWPLTVELNFQLLFSFQFVTKPLKQNLSFFQQKWSSLMFLLGNWRKDNTAKAFWRNSYSALNS